MKIRITYEDATTMDVVIKDAAVIQLAQRQADLDDETAREAQRKQPVSVKAVS